jgi:hypothetical protein
MDTSYRLATKSLNQRKPGKLPEHAVAYRDLFAHVEHRLRRAGFLRKNHKRAVVDWRKFACDLGAPFFEYVRGAVEADTLIREPPRVLDQAMVWQPAEQKPITDVVELFERGVCQVRNNIVHGEKYMDVGTPRDDALVKGANWVLERAMGWHPEGRRIFGSA